MGRIVKALALSAGLLALGVGAARALRFTSEFLKGERKIPAVLPDYGEGVNPGWVEMVLAGGC